MRCKRCNCKVKGNGDLCARCAYEAEWLEHRDYFCSSPGCQKHMPEPTKSGFCTKCEAECRPYRIAKAEQAKASDEKAPGKCQCGARLSKRGYCYACKKWSEIHPF